MILNTKTQLLPAIFVGRLKKDRTEELRKWPICSEESVLGNKVAFQHLLSPIYTLVIHYI